MRRLFHFDNISLKNVILTAVLGCVLFAVAGNKTSQAQPQDTKINNNTTAVAETQVKETEIASDSIFLRAWKGGVVVFTILLILIGFSILSWALMVAKYFYLRQLTQTSDRFIRSFWDSRSLNDLNGRLSEHPFSPAKEVFRVGYAELVRGSQLKDHSHSPQLAIQAAIENLTRSLRKTVSGERKKMEKYLPFLATIASASPFIGLFGTVWGIMGAFEGIAQTGSASLAAVAPGISEALIATAFGLAAAIPALIGYNISLTKIRGLMSSIDGFSSDFLNIVERYLITDRTRVHSNPLDNAPI